MNGSLEFNFRDIIVADDSRTETSETTGAYSRMKIRVWESATSLFDSMTLGTGMTLLGSSVSSDGTVVNIALRDHNARVILHGPRADALTAFNLESL